MKKFLITLALAVSTLAAHALQVTWGVNGATVDDVGKTVYLMMADDLMPEYVSYQDFLDHTVSQGTVTKVAATYKVATVNASNDKIDKTGPYYFVILEDNWSGYRYVQAVGLENMVYDFNNKDPSPGSYTDISFSAIANATFVPALIPEPTSGLLFLLGMCTLALRRRRA